MGERGDDERARDEISWGLERVEGREMSERVLLRRKNVGKKDVPEAYYVYLKGGKMAAGEEKRRERESEAFSLESVKKAQDRQIICSKPSVMQRH